MHSKTSKDSPVLNSFDLRRQLNIDPAYESIQSFLEVVKIDDLTEPNIPLLLPRDVSSIKLQTQNLLNNYLATALCAMAVQEELIYTMLRSDSLNEEGRYTLNFCDMGETHEITVNDEVLVIRENKKVVPYYLSSPGNDIWAYILEKVYAARFGLYSLISDGHPHEVIHSFLDGEYKIFDLKQDNSENVWALIKTYFRSDEPIKNDAEPLNEYIDLNMNENKKIVIVMRQVVRNGVPERSYYRMADYKTVKVKDKLKYIKLAVIDDSYKELVKLVSKPWGEEEASTLDKTQVGPGKIWLLFEDMMKHFSTLSLNTFRFVNLKPEYNKSVLKLGLDGEHSCVLIYFEAPNPDDKYVIGVHQKNKTFFKNLKKDYQYANLRLVLIRLDEKENIKEELLGPDLRDILQKFRGKKIFSGRFESCSVSSANSMADVFLRHRLKRGKYLVALRFSGKSTTSRTST